MSCHVMSCHVTLTWRLGLTQYLASSLGAMVVNIGSAQVT